MRTEMENSRYNILLPDSRSVPNTDDEAQALREIVEENLDEDDAVPRLFQHPCPTCRAPVVQRPSENYLVKGLLDWYNQEVGPSDPAQMDVQRLDSPLFDGLFLDL